MPTDACAPGDLEETSWHRQRGSVSIVATHGPRESATPSLFLPTVAWTQELEHRNLRQPAAAQQAEGDGHHLHGDLVRR